jgi:hypothetical protein
VEHAGDEEGSAQAATYVDADDARPAYDRPSGAAAEVGSASKASLEA